MERTMMGPDLDKSALIIVDMQNDFVHPEGGFTHIAREAPEAGIDMPFLMGTIPYVQQLADAFRAAARPVIYLAHMVKPDYSDAQFPYWRIGLAPPARLSSRAPGGRRLLTRCNPGRAST